MTREEQAAHWRGVMGELQASGMSVAAFCRERNLKTPQVLRWRRHFADEAATSAGGAVGDVPGFVELVQQAAGAVAPPSCGISIQVGERISIRIARGFDPVALKAVLSAVREVAA